MKERNRYRREREKERKRETDSLTARHTVIQIKEGRENERKEGTKRKEKMSDMERKDDRQTDINRDYNMYTN